MKIEKTIKVIKDVNPKTLIMVKIGSFYHSYGKDAYILSYLFNYQIKSIENSYNTCGFPISASTKILKNLEDKKINYMQVSRSENYDVESEFNFKSGNAYEEIYEKAYKYIQKQNKINSIHSYLMDNINQEDIKGKIKRIEEILYDC